MLTSNAAYLNSKESFSDIAHGLGRLGDVRKFTYITFGRHLEASRLRMVVKQSDPMTGTSQADKIRSDMQYFHFVLQCSGNTCQLILHDTRLVHPLDQSSPHYACQMLHGREEQV